MESAPCNLRKVYGRIRVMKTIHVVFHDAGGGHRNAALALQTMIARQKRPWKVDLVQLQELLDRLDVLRNLTGLRIQECYNTLLRKGWTYKSAYLLRVLQAAIWLFHRPAVRLLEDYWRNHSSDLLVSVIPHFNRALRESWRAVNGRKPFVTILTDFADFPPRFWIERGEQDLICGTERAVEQARALSHDERHIWRTSGMILRPEFYTHESVDAVTLRREMGLRENLPVGLVLFGGHGSRVMCDITERIEEAGLPVQLILVCGRNEKLADHLRSRTWRMPVHVIGFTKEVHRIMRAADFFIGKPGPGSISEAIASGLPVIVECNAWTLPQERYNAEWVRENGVGTVLSSFRNVSTAVAELLKPAALQGYRARVRALENRAIFETPEILAKLLAAKSTAYQGEPGEAHRPQAHA